MKLTNLLNLGVGGRETALVTVESIMIPYDYIKKYIHR